VGAVRQFARGNRTVDRLHTIDARPPWQGWAAADLAVLAGDAGGTAVDLAQAAANAVPVIAVDAGEAGALIEHERTGWLIPADWPRERPRALAGAIGRLVEQPALAAQLAERAAHTHQAFLDVDGAARRWDALYASAIQSSSVKEPVP